MPTSVAPAARAASFTRRAFPSGPSSRTRRAAGPRSPRNWNLLISRWRTTCQGFRHMKKSSSPCQAIGRSGSALWKTCRARRFSVSPRPFTAFPDTGRSR